MHVKPACVKFSSTEKHWKTWSGLSLLRLLWRLPMLQAEIWQNLRWAQRLPTLVNHDGRVHVWMWLHSDHTKFCVLPNIYTYIILKIYIYITWCKSSRQLEKGEISWSSWRESKTQSSTSCKFQNDLSQSLITTSDEGVTAPLCKGSLALLTAKTAASASQAAGNSSPHAFTGHQHCSYQVRRERDVDHNLWTSS